MGKTTGKNGAGAVLPPWTRVKRGARVFMVLTILGLVIVLYRSSFASSVSHLRGFAIPYLALACGLMVVDWLASGARIWVFASRLQPGISYVACIRASLANIFLGGMTPSQTGGGPGQIYILYKNGMPVFDATVVSFLGGFLGTAVFLPLCGLLVTVLVDPVTVGVGLQMVVKGSIVAFGLIILLAIVGLIYPRALKKLARRLTGWPPPFKRWADRKELAGILEDVIDRYHSMMRYFLRRAKLAFLAGFGLTSLIYFNKFVIAWVVLRGLGITADFWEVVYSQLVLMLIFYFAPSPGAAGVAEISTAEVMKGIIPSGYEGAFVLVWRLFTLFISLAVGSLVMARAIYKKRVNAEGSIIDYRTENK